MKTQQILRLLKILAWVALAAYIIEAGTTAFLFRPAFNVRPNAAYAILSLGFMIAPSLLKAFVAYLVIKTLSTLNLKNPFTINVAQRLEKISYLAFGVWIVTILSHVFAPSGMNISHGIQASSMSGEFIFMVGIVYLMSQVFKRGVELQNESDLTV